MHIRFIVIHFIPTLDDTHPFQPRFTSTSEDTSLLFARTGEGRLVRRHPSAAAAVRETMEEGGVVCRVLAPLHHRFT